ncbi:MAG TPA: hypothetical protein VIM73_04275 [Polyangiaceae bacterium]
MASQADSKREVYGTQPTGISGDRLQDAVVQALWPSVCHRTAGSLAGTNAPEVELAPSPNTAAQAEPPPESRRALRPWRPSVRDVRVIAIHVVSLQPYEPSRERVQKLPAAPEPRLLTAGTRASP